MLVVAACVGYLIYAASGGSSEYYLTVSELQAHAKPGDVRVAGVVQDDVQKSQGGLHVTFTEKDGTASMPVEYSGALPDIFKPGITVVAAGFYGGQEGSLLYWTLILGVLGSASLLASARLGERLAAYAAGILAAILSFFLFVLAVVASPFELLSATPPDGLGLNPILR